MTSKKRRISKKNEKEESYHEETEIETEPQPQPQQSDVTQSQNQHKRSKTSIEKEKEKEKENEKENQKENPNVFSNTDINDTNKLIPESEDFKSSSFNVTGSDEDETVDQIISPYRAPPKNVLDRSLPQKTTSFTKDNSLNTPTKNSTLPVSGKFNISSTSTSATPTRSTMSDFNLPSATAIGDLIQKRDLKTINKLLHDISHNKTEKLFKEYKKVSEKRQNAADALVASLTEENVILKKNLKSLKQEKQISKEVENLKSEIEQLKKEKMKYIEENNNLRKKVSIGLSSIEEAANGIDLYNTKLEILELLTRATCYDFKEDDENLEFSLKQVGETATHFYSLVISKIGVSDLVYIPLLSPTQDYEGDWDNNLKILQQILPDYLMDNLTFPSSTLSNFYFKLARSLNKKLE